MDLLDIMLGHDHWATTQLLERSRELTDTQLDQQFDIGNRTLRETLDHMIATIDFWTRSMAGQPLPADRTGRPSTAELTERYERYSAAFATFALRARDANRLVDTFVHHMGYPQSLGSTIIHLMYHNAQHRGDARHFLERLGVSDLWDFDPQEWENVTQHG
jgi:uncharacterized damage-inducible protein DinB